MNNKKCSRLYTVLIVVVDMSAVMSAEKQKNVQVQNWVTIKTEMYLWLLIEGRDSLSSELF